MNVGTNQQHVDYRQGISRAIEQMEVLLQQALADASRFADLDQSINEIKALGLAEKLASDINKLVALKIKEIDNSSAMTQALATIGTINTDLAQAIKKIKSFNNLLKNVQKIASQIKKLSGDLSGFLGD